MKPTGTYFEQVPMAVIDELLARKKAQGDSEIEGIEVIAEPHAEEDENRVLPELQS